MKRILSLLVVLALVLVMVPVAFAAEAEPVQLTDTEVTVTNEGTGSYIWFFNGTRILNVFGSSEFSVIYNGETTVSEYEMVTITIEGSFFAPAEFQIVGDGEFNMYIAEPVGAMGNPDFLAEGENVAPIEAGNAQGYYYTWTASNNGTLSLSISAEGGWAYAVNNLTTYAYGDTQWSDSDPVVDEWTVEVSAGDQLQIMVVTYDPENPWDVPAGNVVLTASFAPAGPTAYENVHTFPAGYNNVPAKLTKVDITKTATAVEGADGYMHLNTANGPILYVDLTNDVIDLKAATGAYFMNAYIDGNRVDILPAMTKYAAAMDVNGYYPLTVDLQMFLQNYGANQGWYMAGMSSIDEVNDETAVTAWMFACYYEEQAAESVCTCGAELVHVEATEAGCHTNGNIEYWYCDACGAVWQNAEVTQLTNIKNVVIPSEGTLEHTAESCYNIAYWYCAKCDCYFVENSTRELVNIARLSVIKAEPTHNVNHVEATEVGCHTNGNIEYWYCDDCEGVWQNEELTQVTNIKNVVVPSAGTLEHTAESCYNVEYWYCAECDCFFVQNSTREFVNVARLSLIKAEPTHELVHVEESCYNVEHWYCEACETVWADEALTQITNHKSVIKAEATHELVHVEESCYNVEHWYCEACETVWADEALTQITNHKNVIKAEASHELVHVEATEAGCHTNGNIEYWYCDACETVWADEALTQITNIKNVVVPSAGTLEHTAESCYNVEYWYCDECKCYFVANTNRELINIAYLSTIKAEPTHELVHVEESCYNVEHWYCEACETVWADEALTQITNHKNVIKAEASHELVHVEATEAGCHTNGNIEYWYCDACETVWADEALTQITNIKNVVVPSAGTLEHTAESCYNVEYWYCDECKCYFVANTNRELINIAYLSTIKAEPTHEMVHVEESCYNVEHWYCEACETVWADEALTQITNHKNVIKAEASHKLVHVEATEAGCHTNGNIEFWYCEDCEIVWQDVALTQITNIKNVVIPAEGELQHFAQVDPTTTTEGMKEHWYCAECDCYFVMNSNRNLINVARLSLIIPKVSTPVTGDNTSLIVLVALMVISAMGAAVIFTKKRAI